MGHELLCCVNNDRTQKKGKKITIKKRKRIKLRNVGRVELLLWRWD